MKFLISARFGRDKTLITTYTREFTKQMFNEYTEDKATEVYVWNYESNDPVAHSQRGKVIVDNLKVEK